MGALTEKLKEVTISVIPVSFLVLILHFTGLTPLSTSELIRFIIGAIILIMGLAVFLMGIDLAATPLGLSSGSALFQTNKMVLVLLGGFALGFLITIAEPVLAILAGQISDITDGALGSWEVILAVSVGVGLLIMIGFLRTIKNISLNYLLYVLYGFIFLLCLFVPTAFHAFAFDAFGSTTGAITVPFMLALAVGTSRHRAHREKDSAASFGLTGLAGAGAIVGLLLRGVMSSFANFSAEGMAESQTGDAIWTVIRDEFILNSKEGLLSIVPLIVVLLALQWSRQRFRAKSAIRVSIGIAYCFVGLVLFMTGVKAGFMPAGQRVGELLAGMNKDWLLMLVGFLLGMLTILAEPAVHVLTQQVEEETAGNVPKRLVLIFLAAGVSFSIVLSIMRIVIPWLQLWHILLVGYGLILILTRFTPDLFVGIAYDSGAVASGPISATFILAFAQGAASSTPGADVILDGFGVIALIAMTPLITIQLLGILHRIRSNKRHYETSPPAISEESQDA